MLFCGENFYLEGMRVFSKVHFEVFSDPSGPESRPIHSFPIMVSNWTHFLNLLESSPGAQYQHFHSNHQILMFLNIECRGGYWRNSTFCEKMKFLSKQYRLRKKKRTKNKKSFYTWQTKLKPKKTEIFLLLIASVRRENKFWFFWKSKLPLKETRFGWKNPQILTFFQKSGKNDKKFHFVTARTLFKKFKMLILGPILKNLGNSRPLKSGP